MKNQSSSYLFRCLYLLASYMIGQALFLGQFQSASLGNTKAAAHVAVRPGQCKAI